MFRKVPKGTNWFYTLGSATMFAFLSQAVTGVFLAMYYRPDAAGGAYESVRYITNEVFLGEFVRGMHKWGSSVMVILVFLHMARTFFFGAYKYPRELNWVIGGVLLILTMVMSFTGYLLPFDQRSYWATIVGVNINGTGPVVGPYLSDFLRGGAEFGATTLSRFYAIHMMLIPGAIAALIGAHLYLVDQARHDGTAVAEGQRRRTPRSPGSRMNNREKEIYLREYSLLKAQGKPFFPYAVAKDSLMACVVLATIIGMSILFGAELGPKADPTTTTYVPRPEWYFFFLFEVLRVIKPPLLVPLATIGVPTILMILMLLLPFIDRGPERRPERRPIAMVTAFFVICAMGYLTYLGASAGSPNEIDMKVVGAVRAGQARGGAVGLPRLPQDRRERQRRAGAGADRHRRQAAPGRDPAHAREPDRADALLPGAGPGEEAAARGVPLAAQRVPRQRRVDGA